MRSHALVCQLSAAFAETSHGGKGISRCSERAWTYGSYMCRSLLGFLAAASPARRKKARNFRLPQIRAGSSGGNGSFGGVGGSVWKKFGRYTNAWAARRNVSHDL